MATLDLHNPDRRELREFAVVTGGLVALLFGLAFPWFGGARYPIWPWVVAIGLAAWALAAPLSLKPVYRLWMKLGHAMGRVTTPIVLAAMFFAVFTPIALVMRLLGRDPLSRGFDPQLPSYRVKRVKAARENMEKPF